MRQLELLTSAQLATMRDRTRRRNYSAEAEEFRDAHQRHRAWGLTQRHARKLSRLYGSTANASAAFRRRADEPASPSAPTRTTEPTAPEPTASEPAASEQVAPEPVVAEPVTPEQVVAKATGSEPVGSGPLMPDRGHDAAKGWDPGRPSRPGKHRGRATKGMRRSTRCPRPETDPEPAENHARRHPAPAGGKNADNRRRTRTHRTAASRPKGCRDRSRRDFLGNSPNTPVLPWEPHCHRQME
jgi:hypothetical protein